MPFMTVCVVVISEGKVLLTLRHDFHVWCLPSGGVEDGETVVAAAIRETKEETGLDPALPGRRRAGDGGGRPDDPRLGGRARIRHPGRGGRAQCYPAPAYRSKNPRGWIQRNHYTAGGG